MKIKIFSFICIMLIGFSTNANQNTKNTVEWCEKEYRKIESDLTYDTKEKRANAWKKMKTECRINGVYEKNLGDIYITFYDFKMAREVLEGAIKTANYDTRWLEYKLGIVDAKEKKIDSFKKRADSLIKRFPNWYAGYFFAGVCELTKKNYLEAEKLYLKANELEETPEVYNNLAIVYYYANKDHKKVVTMYVKALWLDQAVALSNLAATYSAVRSLIQLGDLDSAKKILDLQKLGAPDIVKLDGYQATLREYEKAVARKAAQESKEPSKN